MEGGFWKFKIDLVLELGNFSGRVGTTFTFEMALSLRTFLFRLVRGDLTAVFIAFSRGRAVGPPTRQMILDVKYLDLHFFFFFQYVNLNGNKMKEYNLFTHTNNHELFFFFFFFMVWEKKFRLPLSSRKRLPTPGTEGFVDYLNATQELRIFFLVRTKGGRVLKVQSHFSHEFSNIN